MDFGNTDDLRGDAETEMHGVDLDLGKGRFLTVRRAGGANRAYAVAVTEAFRPHQKAREMGVWGEEEARKLLVNVYAKHVLLGWRGIKDSKGKEIPYDTKAGTAFLSQFPEVFDAVKDFCEDMRSFQFQEDKEAEGEIVNFSSSKSAGEKG